MIFKNELIIKEFVFYGIKKRASDLMLELGGVGSRMENLADLVEIFSSFKDNVS